MRQFYFIDHQLMTHGIFTVSPLLKDPTVVEHGAPGTWDYWKDYSEVLLSRCDKMIVIMFEGWEQSVGLKAEIEIAKSLNIPIEYIPDPCLIDVRSV